MDLAVRDGYNSEVRQTCLRQFCGVRVFVEKRSFEDLHINREPNAIGWPTASMR